jgi:hypothetical protein
MGEAFDCAAPFKSLNLHARDQGPACLYDGRTGLLAGRLWPLRGLFARMTWHGAANYLSAMAAAGRDAAGSGSRGPR